MERDLTKGNIVFTLAGFSLPLILSGVLQQLYNWADAFIVEILRGSWRWPQWEPREPSQICLLW